jgi:amidase
MSRVNRSRPDEELGWLDGVAQAELVRGGEVGAVELVEAAIARVEREDERLGFLVAPMFEAAIEAARIPAAGGPLAGVPFLLKDHLATCAGVPHTSGSRFPRDYVASRDSELVRRYKRAGLIPIGTSATCEFALLSTAESVRYGPCRNPWDLGRTTGGSSGGSGAAVAAGCVPIAHANDSGGSIRIPASCCGLFGLKPTRARNSLGPEFGDLAGGLWAEHVLTRSVRDSAAVLDATAGEVAGDPYCAPAAVGRFLAAVDRDPEPLSIAFSVASPSGAPVDRDCLIAVEDAAALCEALGHRVEEASPPLDGEAMEDAFAVLISAGTAHFLTWWEAQVRRSPRRDELEPFTWEMIESGRGRSAVDLLVAQQTLQSGARRIAEFHRNFDLTLTPTLAAPPVPLGYFDPGERPAGGVLDLDARFAAFTWVANATGQPACSVPLYIGSGGLPIGVHFTASSGREDLLLQLSAQLERVRPWRARRPPSEPPG